MLRQPSATLFTRECFLFTRDMGKWDFPVRPPCRWEGPHDMFKSGLWAERVNDFWATACNCRCKEPQYYLPPATTTGDGLDGRGSGSLE